MKSAKELKLCGRGKSSPYSKKFDLGQKSKLKLRDALDKVDDYVYLINCVVKNEMDLGSISFYSIKELAEFVKNDPELCDFFKRYDPLPDYCTLKDTQSAPQKLYRLLIVRLEELEASFPEVLSILGDFLSLARKEFRLWYRYRQMRERGLGERIRRERRIYNKDRAQWCKDRGLEPPSLHDPYGPLELYFYKNYRPRFEGDKLLTRLEDGEKPEGSHDLPSSLRKASESREMAANKIRARLKAPVPVVEEWNPNANKKKKLPASRSSPTKLGAFRKLKKRKKKLSKVRSAPVLLRVSDLKGKRNSDDTFKLKKVKQPKTVVQQSRKIIKQNFLSEGESMRQTKVSTSGVPKNTEPPKEDGYVGILSISVGKRKPKTKNKEQKSSTGGKHNRQPEERGSLFSGDSIQSPKRREGAATKSSLYQYEPSHLKMN